MSNAKRRADLSAAIDFLRDLHVADLDEGAADAVTVGMVFQKEAADHATALQTLRDSL